MAQGNLDPILLEVLWNRLVSVVEEQARALMRTSFTSVVREAGDLSAGLFDRRGRMAAQAVTGTPGHINAMATSAHHFLAAYPIETLKPGDALVTNHPWQTSGHLNDFTVMTPVFREGEVVALFGNCCHALDLGGRGFGADGRQVYEEGLFVPISRLFVGGEPNEDLLRLIRANVRTPFEVVGDLYAQAGSNEVGGVRLLEMMDEFDLPDIESLSDEVCSRSEAAMRTAISELPDGVYEHQTSTDGFDEPIELAVAVRVEGDEMVVDYEGSSSQSERGINVVLNYTTAYTTFGVKCAISPEVPNNDGSFQPIKVTAPEGSTLNAVHPAPVGGRHIIGHFLPGLVHGPEGRRRAFYLRVLLGRRHGRTPRERWPLGDCLPERHQGRACRGDREHLPRRYASSRVPSRLRRTGSPQGRLRAEDGARGAQRLPLDPLGDVRPHPIPRAGNAWRLSRKPGRRAHRRRRQPPSQTPAAHPRRRADLTGPTGRRRLRQQPRTRPRPRPPRR
jgi:hypothetical protein